MVINVYATLSMGVILDRPRSVLRFDLTVTELPSRLSSNVDSTRHCALTSPARVPGSS